jgi:hypothetical protein
MIGSHFIRARITEAAAALFIIAACMWGFYTWSPLATWFVYAAIEPVLPVKEGEPIFFRSRIIGNYEVPVTWVDVLHCRHAGSAEFKQLHRVETEGRIRIQTPETGTIWKYATVSDAKAGDTCFLRSLITVHLPLGVERQQLVDSSLFTVE